MKFPTFASDPDVELDMDVPEGHTRVTMDGVVIFDSERTEVPPRKPGEPLQGPFRIVPKPGMDVIKWDPSRNGICDCGHCGHVHVERDPTTDNQWCSVLGCDCPDYRVSDE